MWGTNLFVVNFLFGLTLVFIGNWHYACSVHFSTFPHDPIVLCSAYC